MGVPLREQKCEAAFTHDRKLPIKHELEWKILNCLKTQYREKWSKKGPPAMPHMTTLTCSKLKHFQVILTLIKISLSSVSFCNNFSSWQRLLYYIFLCKQILCCCVLWNVNSYTHTQTNMVNHHVPMWRGGLWWWSTFVCSNAVLQMRSILLLNFSSVQAKKCE